jgi:hypothetical protein
MAENNWVLQDGRSILVEFEAAASATAWGWFGNRSSGEGLEFATPAVAWTDHSWLRGGQYIMAADVGGATAYADSLSVGNYVVSGKTITDSVGRVDALSVGAYVVSGKTVTDSVVRGDSLSVGNYVVSGKDLNDVITSGPITYADSLSVGSYTVSGISITDLIARNDSLSVGTYVVSGSDLSDELIQPVSDDIQGQGNWYKTKPKFRIKLVKQLTRELEEVRAKKEDAEGLKHAELVIYEALLHEKLVEQFDESLKNLVTEIEYKKTERILNEIKLGMENKKLLLQLEEEEIMFAIMSLL